MKTMKQHSLRMPSAIDENAVRQLAVQFGQYQGVSPGKLNLFFTECRFISPMGVAFLVAQKDHMSSIGWTVTSYFRSDSPLYKFARIFGLSGDVPKHDLSEIRIGEYAVRVTRSWSYRESLETVNEIRELMKTRLTTNQEVRAALDWALWEIVDNAGRHGYGAYDEGTKFTNPVYICAFSYRNGVEIGVADRGVGFFTRLIQKYPDLEPKRVIQHALKDGVKSHESGAGMGLAKTYALVRSAGELSIFTSERGLFLSGVSTREWHCPGLIGTLVKVKFRTDVRIPVEQILGRDIDELLFEEV
jgi:anti-sigma regulatory factor (Ser/Thr protein kinase)